MRVIIIDPYLKDFSGHNFNYVLAMTKELKRKGIPMRVWGNSSAEKACLEIEGFSPRLGEVTTKLFNRKNILRKIAALVFSMKDFKRQLYACLFEERDYRVEQGDIFYFATPYVFEILCLALVLRKKKEAFIENKCKVMIGLNFSCNRESALQSFALRSLFRFACRGIIGKTGIKTVFFSHGELLAGDYRKLLDTEVVLLPEPIYGFYSTGKAPADGKKIVAYIGAARHNKGFDILAEMLERLKDDEYVSKNADFVVQIDVQKQSGSETEITLRAARELEKLSATMKNLKLIKGAVSLDEYYRLLLQSDLVILPHRKGFRTNQSKTFMETVISGRLPLVSSCTSMAYELQKYGLDELVFESGNPESLAKTLNRLLGKFNDYFLKLDDMKKAYEKTYSINSFVEKVLE